MIGQNMRHNVPQGWLCYIVITVNIYAKECNFHIKSGYLFRQESYCPHQNLVQIGSLKPCVSKREGFRHLTSWIMFLSKI